MPTKITRQFKVSQCANCAHCNKTKLRQGRQHCPFPDPERHNGHCVPFQPIKIKRGS
jgi:hypothetical protein